MSTRNVNCLIMVCDGCGEDYEDDYTPHYDHVADGRDATVNLAEWRTDGEQDWCTDCQTAPHTCAPDPEDKAVCARCGGYRAAVEE